MSRETKLWLVIILLVVGIYFGLTYLDNHYNRVSLLEKNDKILRENVEIYKKQILTYKQKQDSLKTVIADGQTEIDSLKTTRELIIINKGKATKEVWAVPNSEMQKKFDQKVKQIQARKR